MSLQDARNFIKKAKESKHVQDAAHARRKEIPTVGREHGYHFNTEELREAMREDKDLGAESDPDTCICI